MTLQFNLGSLLFVVALCALACGFLAWRGPGLDSVILLFLLSVIPVSVMLERLVSPCDRSEQRQSIRSLAGGHLFVGLCSLIPFGLGLILYFIFDRPGGWIPVPLILGISYWVLPGYIACIVPAITFYFLNRFLARICVRQPVQFRIPIVLGTFSILCIAYFVFGWKDGVKENGVLLITCFAAVNAAVIALLWFFWRRIRRAASRRQTAALALLLHCWLFGLGFPVMGGFLTDYFFKLNLSGLFESGPAPEVDPAAWARMGVGLTKEEVIELRGSSGHVTRKQTGDFSGKKFEIEEYWEYHRHGSGFILFGGPDDRAYVVYFDDEGKVSSFRSPLNPHDQSMESDTSNDRESDSQRAPGRSEGDSQEATTTVGTKCTASQD